MGTYPLEIVLKVSGKDGTGKALRNRIVPMDGLVQGRETENVDYRGEYLMLDYRS